MATALLKNRHEKQKMTGRYTRKVVPMEVRGISRGDQDDHRPLPEKAEESLPGTYPHYYGLANYMEPVYSAGNPTISTRSSPTITEGTEATHSWLSMSNGWTGNTTERSSIYSLGEDGGPSWLVPSSALTPGNTTERSSLWSHDEYEFDRQASRRVHHLFEEIDSMLFENRQGSQHLYSECQEWVTRFPHLRILGQQLVPPQDPGFQMYNTQTLRIGSANMLSDFTEQDMSVSQAMHDLSIRGSHMDVASPPSDSMAAFSDKLPEEYTPYEKEEVFEQDGFVEDIIAVDYKSSDDEPNERISKRMATNKRRRISGMPPVTPHACVKDNIGNNTFDFIWSEVISWMRDVLYQYAQQASDPDVVLDGEGSLKDATNTSNVPSFSPPQDILPPSRETSLLSSRLPDKMAARLQAQALTVQQEGLRLDGLLTISTKALQSRPKSTLQGEPDLQLGGVSLGLSLRPDSSFTRFNDRRPLSVRASEQNRLTSARLRTAGRGRLAPLERAKTPNVDDDRPQMQPNEVLRGRGLSTIQMADRLTSPPLTFQRNGALPPISPLDREDPAMKTYGMLQKKTQFSTRASSAIHDKESRLGSKDRAGSLQPDNRPSTTHALYRVSEEIMPSNADESLYRSETPFGTRQRSSTPLGMSSSRLAHGLSTLGGLTTSPNTNVLQLNITGNSINPRDGDPSHSHDLDESSERLEEMIPPQWGASHLPRRTKQQYNMGSVR